MNKQLLNTVLDRPVAMAGWQSAPAEPAPLSQENRALLRCAAGTSQMPASASSIGRRAVRS